MSQLRWLLKKLQELEMGLREHLLLYLKLEREQQAEQEFEQQRVQGSKELWRWLTSRQALFSAG